MKPTPAYWISPRYQHMPIEEELRLVRSRQRFRLTTYMLSVVVVLLIYRAYMTRPAPKPDQPEPQVEIMREPVSDVNWRV